MLDRSEGSHAAGLGLQLAPGFEIPRGPVARVAASAGVTPLPRTVSDLEVQLRERLSIDLSDYARSSDTGAMLVAHRGRIIWEHYAYPDGQGLLRPVMSCSKAVCGTLASILADLQIVDLDALVLEYMGDLRHTSFEGATVRQLLDMTTGTAFVEEYMPCEPTLAERASGRGPGLTRGYYEQGIMQYVHAVHNVRSHGEVFNYRSILTDLLAQVLERASGHRYADLLGHHLWDPMGAEDDLLIYLDPSGRPFASVGMWMSPRDLMRLGMLWASEGHTRDGARLLSSHRLAETWNPDADVKQRFRESPYRLAATMPGGWYRNLWWSMGDDIGALVALGIYGQLCFVHRHSETVVVKLSSWPRPDDDTLMANQLEVATGIATVLDRPQVADWGSANALVER